LGKPRSDVKVVGQLKVTRSSPGNHLQEHASTARERIKLAAGSPQNDVLDEPLMFRNMLP
jgi:hypothetical protein